jgi:uncharacterized protein YjbJ (UPF0337 family)
LLNPPRTDPKGSGPIRDRQLFLIQVWSGSMNWDRVEGNWKQVSGKIKQQWGKLTDDSLTQINGKRDELVGRIQEAYGVTRDDAERQVKDWESMNQ